MRPRPRILIFGAGQGGRRARRFLGARVEVVAFLDNDPKKEGTRLAGRPVLGPAALRSHAWDRVVIASMHEEAIFRQLLEMGVPVTRIDMTDRAVLFGDDDRPWLAWIAVAAAGGLGAALVRLIF